MPYMDDAMLDLFGEDAVNDGLAALQVQDPESAAVLQRLDQLQTSGCCQHLTWSKNATLAYISADGRTINFRLVVRDPETLLWAFTSDSPAPITAQDDVQFVHVQWSSVGLDLVALDQYGRPHLYQLAFALDRVQPHTLSLPPPTDDLNTVVGLHWLPVHTIQFRPPHHSIGIREGNEWSNKMGATNIDWPHHLIDGKSAFLMLTESHVLKLYYQQDFGPWSEASASLWESGGTEEILTHAAFSDENKCLHLVTYSSHGALSLYKVTIDWSSSQSKDPTRPPFQIVQAQLRVDYLCGLETIITQPTPDTGLDVQQALYRSRLTNLSILPPSPLMDSRHSQIQATFSYAGDPYNPQNPSTSCSAILRWDIMTEEPELLDVFKTFKSANAKLAPEAVTVIKRLPDMCMSKIILHTATVLSEPYIVLATSDGSIDFHTRTDLQMLNPDNDDTKASSYAQTGFAFMPTEKYCDVALTPDASVAAALTNDGRIVLKIMEYLPGWDDSDTPDYRTQAALCTIARSVATLAGLVISADEPFALLPLSLPQAHRHFLIKQIYRMLQRPFDFTLEENRKMSGRILRDSVLAKTLSTHLFASYSQNHTLDLPGKVVWISLNLRLIASSIAATVTPKDPSKADAVIALGPSVKWCIDLCVHILDDLAETTKHSAAPIPYTTLTQVLARTGSPTILLLLSSTPRALLRMTLELLKMYFPKMAQCTPTSIHQRVAIQELMTYSRTLPVKLPHLESVLVEVDSGVRQAYNSAKLSQSGRVDSELRMLVEGEVPEALQVVVEHVFSPKIAGKVVESIDRGALWGWDTSGLGIRDGVARKGQGRLDVVRKTQVAEGTRVRVCKRCGSLMEDVWVGQERQGLPAWLQHAQRNCVCLGYWMVEA
ncbi:hypothetical protein KVT40_006134 [Elsinoe batatas]|uniref:Mediator of RNA polymerase II transcription subunit 16 n=1 Tax=Elsinoe batatas TaxID=2601811 RepID=A0A8K0L4P9_9PEZI|nr:hypothetical protein KVT40_006134 [Elsinoe batatas]